MVNLFFSTRPLFSELTPVLTVQASVLLLTVLNNLFIRQEWQFCSKYTMKFLHHYQLFIVRWQSPCLGGVANVNGFLWNKGSGSSVTNLITFFLQKTTRICFCVILYITQQTVCCKLNRDAATNFVQEQRKHFTKERKSMKEGYREGESVSCYIQETFVLPSTDPSWTLLRRSKRTLWNPHSATLAIGTVSGR